MKSSNVMSLNTLALCLVMALPAQSAPDATESNHLLNAIKGIEEHKYKFQKIKQLLFNLDENGQIKGDDSSLDNITWNPSHDSVNFAATYGVNYSILPGNYSFGNGKINNSIGIIGENENQRYLFLATSPQNIARFDFEVNDDFWSFYNNAFDWLIGKSRPEILEDKINVVIAHHDESYWFKEDSKFKEWLVEEFGESVTFNEGAFSCDGQVLSSCINADTDLLILSSHYNSEDDLDAVYEQVKRAEALGIPLLFTNHYRDKNKLSIPIFEHYAIRSVSQNYWAKTGLNSYDPSIDYHAIDTSIAPTYQLLTHLRDDSFSFNISECQGSCNSDAYQVEFKQGVDDIRSWVNQLDRNKVNIFESDLPTYQKEIIQLADDYRQSIVYPMSYDTTETLAFLQAYFADHVIHNYRTNTPAQPDLGNFSRSDFSHIFPDNKGVELVNHGGFKSTGAYALPGQTVTVRRQDSSSDIEAKVFVNTQRNGSTKEFDRNGYKRPKFLRSTAIAIEPGETIQFTSPYGGPIQVEMSGTKKAPIALLFSNVGEHAHYPGLGDSRYFEEALSKNEFDWAEISTDHFEVHSTAMKMGITMANSAFDNGNELIDAIERYTHNYPHVLAGFQGPGIDEVPEIIDWAKSKGLDVRTQHYTKHMNADQATCGSGCSGNPYDAFWSFNPIGHGDIHELGHGLEKSRLRFNGFTGHSATNFYSYYTQSMFRANTGKSTSCQNLNSDNYFAYLQEAFNQDDPSAYMESLNLGSKWQTGPALYLQMMMQIEERGLLQNGWHLYPRLHILLREYGEAIKNDDNWTKYHDKIGLNSLTREEAKALSQNDWLAIMIAYASGLDFTPVMESWGLTVTDTAKYQIATFGVYKADSDKYYRYENDQYCDSLIHETLPIDGLTRWNGMKVEGVNIALGKPVSASSEHSDKHSMSKINDGDTDTYYHTKWGSTHWLEIDLEQPVKIEQLLLTNRNKYDSNTINGATISLLDNERNTAWSQESLYFESLGEAQLFEFATGDIPEDGVRYIRLELDKKDNMALGEIEAFVKQ
ncbi:ImpA family metalloprotease [Vibrio sp. Isolate34]|uniref:ImpA family metalloprotease n=1 Tax=Vibrio sp. Isolate34 TaxID=2908540 RepID=UPI001EFEDB42|nr:ImpA family metalloprotease [Vibrio sp. Isolate34]MCG9641983.1 ImpA family metalloprotease [Vibrio sp. Isolate34]